MPNEPHNLMQYEPYNSIHYEPHNSIYYEPHNSIQEKSQGVMHQPSKVYNRSQSVIQSSLSDRNPLLAKRMRERGQHPLASVGSIHPFLNPYNSVS